MITKREEDLFPFDYDYDFMLEIEAIVVDVINNVGITQLSDMNLA